MKDWFRGPHLAFTYSIPVVRVTQYSPLSWVMNVQLHWRTICEDVLLGSGDQNNDCLEKKEPRWKKRQKGFHLSSHVSSNRSLLFFIFFLVSRSRLLIILQWTRSIQLILTTYFILGGVVYALLSSSSYGWHQTWMRKKIFLVGKYFSKLSKHDLTPMIIRCIFFTSTNVAALEQPLVK